MDFRQDLQKLGDNLFGDYSSSAFLPKIAVFETEDMSVKLGIFMDKACSLWEQTCGRSLSLSPPIIFFCSQRNEVPVCCMTTTRWLCRWYNKYRFSFKETVQKLTCLQISGGDISHGQDHLNPLLHPRLLLQSS